MSGTLYGVGLGPGDPELITLKAARLIGAAKVLAWPAPEEGDSLARRIAVELIPKGAREIAIRLPMRAESRDPAQAAYDRGATEIAAVLETGEDVVCLCEGDPMFYGSFMYLFARLSARFPVEIVPGVTSVSAASARARHPLAARDQAIHVLPAPLSDAELAERIAGGGTIALMKLGRHAGRVKALVAELGLLDHAVYVERATWPDERILPLAEAPEAAPYFSLALISGGRDPWL